MLADQIRKNYIRILSELIAENEVCNEERLNEYYDNICIETNGDSYIYYEFINDEDIQYLIERFECDSFFCAIESLIEGVLKPCGYEYGLMLVDFDINGNILTVDFTRDNQLNEAQDYGRVSENDKSPDIVRNNVKTTFEDKYKNRYTLTTEIGNFKPDQVTIQSNTLYIIWNHEEEDVRVHTSIFPEHSNIVRMYVPNTEIKREIQIFKIPVSFDDVQEFFTKVYFNQLKHFVNKEVIKVEPFTNQFVFWNPEVDYFYSFSSPNRNKILLDLIKFVNARSKPILDVFFEKNQIKHKQGYLQTLLNAAREAKIFNFYRDGNRIIVEKGKNYRAFIEGKIRRV